MKTESKHKWTIGDIRHFLSSRVGYQIPRSTLARWKSFLGIQPVKVSQRVWLYDDQDRDWLIALALWLNAGRTLDQFEQRFNQEKNSGNPF
jgi:DNA-binding transcriptional MerR regulator